MEEAGSIRRIFSTFLTQSQREERQIHTRSTVFLSLTRFEFLVRGADHSNLLYLRESNDKCNTHQLKNECELGRKCASPTRTLLQRSLYVRVSIMEETRSNRAIRNALFLS